MSSDSEEPVAGTVGIVTYGPEIARNRHHAVAVPVKPDARFTDPARGYAPDGAEAAGGSGNNPSGGDVARDRRVAGHAVQHDFAGTAPQLLRVAAPLDLLSAVGNRQHDAARLPPDDLLARVGERDADEHPVWAGGLGGI